VALQSGVLITVEYDVTKVTLTNVEALDNRLFPMYREP
jgi:hypothetical protein